MRKFIHYRSGVQFKTKILAFFPKFSYIHYQGNYLNTHHQVPQY